MEILHFKDLNNTECHFVGIDTPHIVLYRVYNEALGMG